MNGRRQGRPVRVLGRRMAVPFRHSWTEHLGFLDFEQPAGIAGKLTELRPFRDIRAAARGYPRAIASVHGVNAGLESVMLGAQADESRCLQAARV